MTRGWGLTAKADQPDHKKYNTPKLKMDNEKKHFAIFHKCQ